ncbi:zinc ribbon domain-containing protein [Paenibacillus spongiae]|uniref:Zinc ribbon domain-containing protein n=1 Tax=Paenibacillus spongiae TaxID=2909671 RepID=A0ABY5S6R6_9BACL|nr:zinc ribbon domain-containing protein [Paenibacillus spongiae]UVI28018.1 zinc ribbon domain-containing protein [Paenibacillus spongiae]
MSDDDFPNADSAQEEQGFETITADDGGNSSLGVEELLAENFKCSKCGGEECSVQEVAMTGTGLSKLLDIQHHHYLYVSCENCGFVEIYNPDVLRRMKSGTMGTVLDTFFG